MWAAPALWRSALRNVLAFYICRQNLAVEDALLIMTRADDWLQGRERQWYNG